MLSIIFEDDFILVVNKPSNLLVHHSHYARNIDEESLVQLLRSHVGAQVHTIHRLDRKTSGLLVFAKTAEATRHLQAQFESGTVKKTYLALVRGHISEAGFIDTPIKNADDGVYREALTHYIPLAHTETDIPVDPYPTARYTLLQLKPSTGRMHQLRKHMNKIAHPIIGDPKYGNRHHNHMFEAKFGHSMLYLHASHLSFVHPSSKEVLKFSGVLPEHWGDLVSLGFLHSLIENLELRI